MATSSVEAVMVACRRRLWPFKKGQVSVNAVRGMGVAFAEKGAPYAPYAP